MNIFESLEAAGDGDLENITARREDLRAREFYKYYQPICALRPESPTLVNLYDPEVRANHVPKSASDRILTALCQLTALRLSARRCMLFFFDREHAYILAEATRSLSLVDDKLHEEFDGLWLGETIVPKSITVCQNTVNIPEANYGSNRDQPNAGLVHIISNLADNTHYCDRPFVTEGPQARFYAGVPIVTPNGYRIGALCVLDEKPRDGMDEKDITFLSQMGVTVMDHIETIRSRAEFSRGSNMLTSMESFYSSAPGVAAATSRKASLLPVQEMAVRNVSPKTGYFQAAKPEVAATQPGAETTVTSPPDGTGSDTTPTVKDGPKISPAADELDLDLEHNIKSTFETAATLIRTASDVDGITFVKVADRAHDTLHGAARLSRGTESDLDSVDYGDRTSTDGGPTTDTDRDERMIIAKTCSVLGTSHKVLRSLSQPHIDKIPAKMLRSLLRRYPLGKVWFFDAEGETIQGESSSSDYPAAKRTSSSSPRDSLSRSSSRRVKQSRSKDSRDIERLFPGARALGIVPMYDSTRNRVFSAGIIWTYSPVRILTTEGDLGYLRSFAEVIMGNVARLQAKNDDLSKANFISSISHELRSPLHGILGSIDFLQESDSVDQTIVSQIEKCSITLMDVIDHLLEYSKINNLNQARTGTSRGSRVQAWLDHSAQAPGRTQSLPKITEEVADATFYSHCCNLEAKDHGNVAFVLDVASEHLEEFKVPVGAYKRLLINIINNALKYTETGHVSVSLKASHKARRRPMAVLTVTDTGCGMSKDFLEHSLFKAFSQEDPLKSGTGLGLSLVAKLVKSMNGKIEVQSAKGVGTSIKVSIPIELKDSHSRVSSSPPFGGLRIRLPAARDSSDAIKSNDQTLQHVALERMCKVLGAESVEDDPHVTLLSEGDLSQALSNDALKESLASKAVIVLCTSFASAATLRHSALPSALDCFVDFIPQPYGPARLLEALRRCLIALEARGATPLSSMLEAVSSMSIDESRPDDTPPAQVREYRTESYIEDLRHAYGRGRSRKTSTKQFFPSTNSTVVSDETATADDRAVATPGSVQSILATPSTNGQASAAATPAQEEPPNKDDRHRPLSLMIVDDNRINVRILMTYADRNKHPRITASNGLEAVEAYQAAAAPDQAGIDPPKIMPEVIFMDINMPICDGFEASRRIRAFEKSNSLKPSTIIALTGLGSAAAHQQSLASGIDVFLTKPIRPKDLTPLLESIAQGRRENDEM